MNPARAWDIPFELHKLWCAVPGLKEITMSRNWRFKEMVILTHRMYSAAANNETPQRAHATDLRDSLFPNRSVDSVLDQAWDIYYTLRGESRSKKLGAVIVLFEELPTEMHALAQEFERAPSAKGSG
jgi:hypothetical protein